MLELFAVGIISGIISPLILSILRHIWIWKRQKILEIKYETFDSAVQALSMYAADALDPILQYERKSRENIKPRKVEMRLETSELLEKAKGMIDAYFSEETSKLYDEAIRTKISIEDIPCTEFEDARAKAIIALSKELGLK
ncbi:MAG TPA: hypothetical protein ENH23_06770 [candidate division Zixibacteria bacterium]|nr:hypothetical protein [candidate division Zixibacteria bacterium]